MRWRFAWVDSVVSAFGAFEIIVGVGFHERMGFVVLFMHGRVASWASFFVGHGR
jgi:hypothetical protein